MSLVTVVGSVIDFYSLLVFVYVILSWFPLREGLFADVYRVLGSLTEPYIGVFRRVVPLAGPIDFSPLIALLVLQYLIRPGLIALIGALGL